MAHERCSPKLWSAKCCVGRDIGELYLPPADDGVCGGKERATQPGAVPRERHSDLTMEDVKMANAAADEVFKEDLWN